MLAQWPVVQSRAARWLLLSSALVTAALILWAQFVLPGAGRGLSPIFRLLFENYDVRAGGWMLLVLVLAATVSRGVSAERWLAWISDHIGALAVATAVLLGIASWTIYQRHPLSMDEYAAYFQSQVFAGGRLSGQFPVEMIDWLVPPSFQSYFFSVSKTTGEAASAYWPSFSLLMAPFTAVGVPWACNPVLSALTLLAVHRLALLIFADQPTAALAVLLTLASPEFFINGFTYYSMPAHLLANTVYALLLVQPTRNKALLAGVLGSIALTLHNPFPHLLFALPWIWWMARQPDGTQLTLRLLGGYVPLSLLLGLGWLAYMGHLRHTGAPVPPSGNLTSMLPVLAVFSLPDATILLARLIGIFKIWFWSVPGLLLLAAAGAWRGRADPALRLLILSMLLTLLGYFLVPVDQGHGWGYRYFHTAWIVLPLLAAGALTGLPRGRSPAPFADERVRAAVVSCALLSLLISGAVRAQQVQSYVAAHLAQLPAYRGGERRVILINADSLFYGRDLVQNDPWLRGDVVRLLSHGHENDVRMMAQSFPELREVYSDAHGAVWSSPLPR